MRDRSGVVRRIAAWSAPGAVAVVTLACGPAVPPELTEEERDQAIQIGTAASDHLMATLLAHLTEAMSTTGPVGAIEVCSTRALDLTAGVAAEMGPGFEIKRTSFRARNPENAPDEDEVAALSYFEMALAERGELPESYVQRVDSAEIRYYRPLTVAPPCLGCHGPQESLAPGVAEVLGRRYPEDRATGYGAGDFRGVIRVSIPSSRIAG